MSVEPEVVQGGALSRIVKAEVDMQVSTAKAYPRNMAKFRERALEMVRVDQDTAASMRYVLPRKDKDGNRINIEGPSVRLAEIVAGCWGNLRAGARVVEEGERFVEAQGFAWDLETNYREESSHRRRITTSSGRRYSDDMIQTTGNAAASIAFREAVFKVVPRSEVDKLFREARRVAIGTGPIEVRRDRAVGFFVKQYQATPELVAKLAGVQKVEDIQDDQLHTLTGLKQALAEGEATWEGLVAEVTGAMASGAGQAGGEPAEVDLDGLVDGPVEASNDARGGQAPPPEPQAPAGPPSAPEPAEQAEVKGDVAEAPPEAAQEAPSEPKGQRSSGRKRRSPRRREAPEEPLPAAAPPAAAPPKDPPGGEAKGGGGDQDDLFGDLD